ncbi:beta-lactamase domain protein [Opitutus terrae PB90-1]|uniref:Beta-lactamase domain protein n=2 Tax=Opitutus terrae TaxID=107709 RepID=B1ZTG4_OPITP|nr:beta-lactamase domain protein [Opitutus terrae PB90-1]
MRPLPRRTGVAPGLAESPDTDLRLGSGCVCLEAMSRQRDWPEDLWPIRGVMSVAQLLVDSDGAVLLDTGFPVDLGQVRRVMRRADVGPRDVRAIILTHGHIDHAGNAAALKAWTGAPVYAHPAEQPHLDGVFPYRGAARVCGRLEAIGRAITHYRPVKIDVPIANGDELPLWGGLWVVHLPGHTVGHCGFYSPRHDLLFTGDLWVRFMMRTQVSPKIFSDAPELRLASLRKARAIGARWIVPGHYDVSNATRLRRRFEELCEEIERRRRVSTV